ncbi:MAG: hypothetical protein JOY90_08585 [Bradyrhizobium sp.]|uniref:hypothetical protein n=1 Tax=Bradyrhizobium sp. TaxID=376 RepID=UPI001E0A9EE0|nr:hypothetical protein [Bradyrhizobium sp.]MBV9560503.1 hypothetical protein [Bradyrhizobium sp.]
MVIEDISFIPVQALLSAAYGMSKSLATARAATLVRLKLADGTEGIGEAWGLPQANLAYLPLLKSCLTGVNVLDIEHAYSLMLARQYLFGVQGPLTWCISGIDIAAKDAAGKLLKQPVHRLIGGKQADNVHIYASGGYLTNDSERDLAPQIEAMAKSRHRAVKIKIGISPASDEPASPRRGASSATTSRSWSTSIRTTRSTSRARASAASRRIGQALRGRLVEHEIARAGRHRGAVDLVNPQRSSTSSWASVSEAVFRVRAIAGVASVDAGIAELRARREDDVSNRGRPMSNSHGTASALALPPVLYEAD